MTVVDQLTKGIMAVMHQVAILQSEVSSLRKANKALSKRQRAKRTSLIVGSKATLFKTATQ